MSHGGASARAAPSVIGAARARFDVSGLWAAEAAGPSRWEQATLHSRRLVEALAALAEQAVPAGAPDVARAGCSIGSLCGFAHVAESIQARLSARGPAWLDPEAFVYHPAHALAGLISRRLGLSGAAMTFLGPTAGGDALEHAVRSLSLGRQPLQLAGAYEVLTPAVARRLGELGVSADCDSASAAFVLLAPSEHAAAERDTPLARSRDRHRRLLAAALRDGWPRVLAPFVALGVAPQPAGSL